MASTSKDSDSCSNDTADKQDKVCIIHFEKSSCDNFTFISQTKQPSERFNHIRHIRELRLAEPTASKLRMTDICENIPLELRTEHGYHRDCYQHFTNHVDRLKKSNPLEISEYVPCTKRRKLSCDTISIFNKDCIFCNKEGKISLRKKGHRTTETTQTFKSDAWKTVLECAESKQDEKLLVRIRDCDLFASEARFHPNCRRVYLAGYKGSNINDNESKTYQSCLEDAHKYAFDEVCSVVAKEIIIEQKVMKLTDLLKTYVEKLENTSFKNPEYRSEKLKRKLENKFGNKLLFCKLDDTGKFESQLVYNAGIELESAIKSAFVLGEKNMMSDCALYLRQSIISAYKNSEELKWPVTAEHLENAEEIVPKELQTFLQFIFKGKIEDPSTATNRVIISIGQDICRAATRGEWKLPKHILLAMTLRHLYRSRQLTTLLNRLGHCESDAFTLELETSIANALEETSSLLSTKIIRNPEVPSLFHSEFDNFDQLINTLRGTDSVHTAHGIMLQEIVFGDSLEHGGTVVYVPTKPKTKDLNINVLIRDELPNCFVGQRKSPPIKGKNQDFPEYEGSFEKANDKNLLWILLRNETSANGQEVAGWTGFTSVTGTKPDTLTTIDYYPVINHPITDYRTVQECLRYAEEASREVGQTYTVTTFDLGVCMKALPLIWNDPDKYKNHIVMIGTFHLICAYLKMVGKKMAGSGLSDIMIEAGLIGSGSMLGVFSGKNYERALHCHKVILESLERILLEQFMSENQTNCFYDELQELSREKIESLIHSPSRETMEQAVSDQHTHSYIRKYAVFKEGVRNGSHGKTAMFWISYMDHIWIVLCLLRAVKTNDFALYAETLNKMPDIFFSFDGQNYARYLTYFCTFLANIEETHPGASELLKRGAMSVARSFIPGNRCAVDKTMEETFMKHAKSHSGTGACGAGISGISTNYNAYQRWVRTAHERSKFVETTFNMADMLDDRSTGKRHKELRPLEIQKSDKEVCDTVDAIKNFLNPFTIEDKENLFCISSGSNVPQESEKDILKAEERGKDAKNRFITERLHKQDKFFEPIKRLNLKSMEVIGKSVKIKTGSNKEIQYKQQGNVAIQLLVRSQKPETQVTLEELLKYPLTPVPFSIGTADGRFAKTDKSKGMKYLLDGVEFVKEPSYDKTRLLIEDGNALFHSMKEVPGNFKLIAEKLFVMMPKNTDVIFSTDMYKEDSGKTMERTRRGSSEKLLIQGENTKRPVDWKAFLTNDDNKTQLARVICAVWGNDSYAKRLFERQVIFICEGEAHHYTTEDGKTTVKTRIEQLDSNQEETDTRVVLYCLYAKSQGYKSVQVRSPDSDIFFILLHYIERLEGITVLFDTGVGNHRRLIDLTEVSRAYSAEYRAALLGLHAFCGCDSTSAFKGRGHTTPIKTLEKRPKFTSSLAMLGNSWRVNGNLVKELDEFTCAMYGNPRFTSVDELRVHKIKDKCEDKPLNAMRNVDMATLPPCKSCLRQHINRVNYEVAIWKLSHETHPNLPNITEGQGWTKKNGALEPLWTDHELLPPRMIGVLEETLSSVEFDEDNDDAIC